MYTCQLCLKQFKLVTNTHLTSAHSTNLKEYTNTFGNEGCSFVYPHLLPKEDPKFLKWKESLKSRIPWNRGLTKETHPTLDLQSKLYKSEKIDRFAKWREEMTLNGKYGYSHLPLAKTKELAFLIGIILGDSHLQKLPRVERLEITLDTDKPELWRYVAAALETVFSKKPIIRFRKTSKCLDLIIHQKNLSERLGIPFGARGNYKATIPTWVSDNNEIFIAYLKGLYEAEGSLSIHLTTCTYNLASLIKMPHCLIALNTL